jgi:hypothetical protein
MKRILGLAVCAFLSGCAVTVGPGPSVEQPQQQMTVTPKITEHVFPTEEAIGKLLLGVSREEALALIGRTVTVGYELREGANDEYQPTTSPNPYRSQQITKSQNVYQVDYYLTRITKADGVISDDELTPLVFQDNKLIGKGWEFFKEKTK